MWSGSADPEAVAAPNGKQHPVGRIISEFKEFLLLRQEQGRRYFPGRREASGVSRPAFKAEEGMLSLETLGQAIAGCRRCRLFEQRTQGVPGQGSPAAWLMVVGEGPGYEEDRQGRPFVGPAGELLTRMLKAIELNRDEVYITNVVKCRPPDNRVPREDEIRACFPFLKAEINGVRPKLLLAMGTTAAQTLTGARERISLLRKKELRFEDIKVKATFHPAFLLRNTEQKREAWEDLKEVQRFYHELAEKK
jgi:DNA polymerase